MSATFSRTLRSLEADRSRRLFIEALLFILFGGWTAWMLLGQVAVYEVSERARLEVKSAAHPVASPVGCSRTGGTKTEIRSVARALRQNPRLAGPPVAAWVTLPWLAPDWQTGNDKSCQEVPGVVC